jgi:hypothetical protein
MKMLSDIIAIEAVRSLELPVQELYFPSGLIELCNI